MYNAFCLTLCSKNAFVWRMHNVFEEHDVCLPSVMSSVVKWSMVMFQWIPVVQTLFVQYTPGFRTCLCRASRRHSCCRGSFPSRQSTTPRVDPSKPPVKGSKCSASCACQLRQSQRENLRSLQSSPIGSEASLVRRANSTLCFVGVHFKTAFLS